MQVGEIVQLVPHTGPTDGWAVLEFSVFPVIVGNSVENVSWRCVCGAHLARGISHRQVLGLLIRCANCSVLLKSPARQVGTPIARSAVYIPPKGQFQFGETLDVSDKPIMTVGRPALTGYARETGRAIQDVYEPAAEVIAAGLDPDSLRTMSQQLRSLLGDNLDALWASDLRGLTSPTPPKVRNRMVELIRFADKAAADVSSAGERTRVTLNADLMAEALTVLANAARWSQHPAWHELKSTLATAEARHSVILLTLASALVDWENGVGIYVGSRRGRAEPRADLWIEQDLAERVDIEIKGPKALQGPRGKITEKSAVELIDRALKRSSKQRRSSKSNLLTLGGYNMGPSFDVLLSTAQAFLALERRRWQGLVGIGIIDCAYEMEDDGQTRTLTPVARVDVALHPGYVGDAQIV